MKALKLIVYSVKQLSLHKLRTAFSVLGIIVGVSAVIAITAIGEGSQKAIEARFSSMGANLLIITPGQLENRMGRTAINRDVKTLTTSDIDAISEICSEAVYISPVNNQKLQVKYENTYIDTDIVGTLPNYQFTRNFSLENGRFLDDDDNRTNARVAVLGATVTEAIFGTADPVDEYINIGKINFRIIGVLKEKGVDLSGVDQDDLIILPLNTAQRSIFKNDYLTGILIKIENKNKMVTAENTIREILREEHMLDRKNEDDDFSIKNQNDILEAELETSKTYNLLITSIAAISLFIGGIGIFASMLMSVRERTNEIGLRKAIGACKSEILIQFLLESAVMGIAGGILGIVIGIVSTAVISLLSSWPVFISLNVIVLSFSFSFIVGIVFGSLPARNASLLEPIDALRWE
jgi:putative ABC transport system permease protein